MTRARAVKAAMERLNGIPIERCLIVQDVMDELKRAYDEGRIAGMGEALNGDRLEGWNKRTKLARKVRAK